MQARALSIFVLLLSAIVCVGFALTAFAMSDDLAPGDLERQSLFLHVSPAIPDRFRRDVTYALDLIELPDSEHVTVDGPSSYVDYHKGGWSDCLLAFLHDWRFPDNTAIWSYGDGATIPPPLTISLPNVFGGIREKGWSQCRSNLEQLLQHKSEMELRDHILGAISRRKMTKGFGLFALAIVLTSSALIIKRRWQTNAEQ